MILVDTAVWISHLHTALPRMSALLRSGQVAVHPFVRGEIALGSLRGRAEILGALGALPQAPLAEHDEVFELIERHELWSTGLGWVDCHLLASARLGHHRLWTLDRPLAQAAGRLDVAFLP